MTWHRIFAANQANPAHSGPYTIESENSLTGTRQHRKATKYESFEEADARAKQEASRSRKFATYNVLDQRGAVVSSHQGVAG